MNTLLLNFIHTETSQYIEPVREGTAKGDPIGLSSIKYKSTLLFLTNLKGKEIAEAVGVSYGLLRVWRTEDLYLTAIERHTRTFAGIVVKHVVGSVKGRKAKGPSDTEIIKQFAQDFADIALYSDRLMNDIYKRGTMRSDYAETTFYRYLTFLGFIFALRKRNNLRQNPEVVQNSSVFKSHAVRVTYSDVLDAFQRPWTPDKEKAEQVKVSFLKAV